jgi:hypothetical protein
LNDEVPEDLVGGQDLLDLGHVLRDVGQVVPDTTSKRLLHVVEVRPQVVHPEGAAEVRLVAPREEFGHVAEVAQPVVDWRCGKHEECLGSRRVISRSACHC